MQIARFSRYSCLVLLIVAISLSCFAGVVVSVTIAPPVLPVYSQPPCPGDGYIWTPGYWAYGPDGYYWVPGTWVAAPSPGLLWTPGYWGWNAGLYVWHPGYWGPHIGFYGGVNYGFGYFGVGYAGGYWHGGTFFYNRAVNNVNVTNIHIYNKTVINNVTVNNVSYNGGRGGIRAEATPGEQIAYRERHFEPTNSQM
ncbi:MAG: YXWGXW repeat-containing protein, partial [Acidobacteria bacterium]|nr:YXWGXW repeat-containing protein [Acidobacteriota bacterium]